MSKKWETITFDQIKAFDRLKVSRVMKYGTRTSTAGTAWDNQFQGFWYSADGTRLAAEHETDVVIKRRIPKQPKPEPLPTKVGSVILVSEMFGFTVFEPPMPLHLTPSCSWVQIGGHRSYDAGSITKWEHASVLATSTLYK